MMFRGETAVPKEKAECTPLLPDLEFDPVTVEVTQWENLPREAYSSFSDNGVLNEFAMMWALKVHRPTARRTHEHVRTPLGCRPPACLPPASRLPICPRSML